MVQYQGKNYQCFKEYDFSIIKYNNSKNVFVLYKNFKLWIVCSICIVKYYIVLLALDRVNLTFNFNFINVENINYI